MEFLYARFLGLRNLYGFQKIYRSFIHLRLCRRSDTFCQYGFVNLNRFLDLFLDFFISMKQPPLIFFYVSDRFVCICMRHSVWNGELYIDSLYILRLLKINLKTGIYIES